MQELWNDDRRVVHKRIQPAEQLQTIKPQHQIIFSKLAHTRTAKKLTERSTSFDYQVLQLRPTNENA
jgi:hypothetical protein